MLLSLILISTITMADPIKIAVVDTGLNLQDTRFTKHLCKEGHKDFTGKGIKDTEGHGTHVAGLIVDYAKDANYCLLIIKYYLEENSNQQNYKLSVQALKEAVDQKATIVNYSGGGPEFMEDEFLLIKNHPEITFVVAAGNESDNLEQFNSYYPARYNEKNMMVVGALHNGRQEEFTNYGLKGMYWEEGHAVLSTAPTGKRKRSGSSMATAIRTGKLIYEKYR